MTQHLQHFIDGEHAESSDGGRLSLVNPVDEQIYATAASGTAADVDRAVRAAHAQLRGGAWSKLNGSHRAVLLNKLAALVERDIEMLADMDARAIGRSPMEPRMMDVPNAVANLRAAAGWANQLEGRTIPTGGYMGVRTLSYTVREPVGVVGAIVPWNSPLMITTWKLAPLLAAGCTVVIKPAEQTPLTALAAAELAQRAGMPPGVLNMLTSDAEGSVAIGKVLCASDTVRHLSFTGSTEVGRILMAQSAPSIKKLALELGGNAPFIVFDDADMDAAIEGALASKYRNAGQTCVCANRLYVQDGIYDAFVERLAQRVAAMKVGNGFDSGVQIGPLIDAPALAKVQRHVDDAVSKGARVLTGGHAIEASAGRFYAPTVLANADASMLCAREETFGPVAPVFRFATEADAIAAANATEFGLAAYFYSRDVGRIFRVGEALEYGIVGINTGIISNEVAPFGGVKQSGLGREGSHHGIDEYVELKYMCLGDIDR